MLKLEDMELVDGYVRNCNNDCNRCVLFLASGRRDTALSLHNWGCVFNGTFCADVLQAWQKGKLVFINGEWYEVEQ